VETSEVEALLHRGLFIYEVTTIYDLEIPISQVLKEDCNREDRKAAEGETERHPK
jgi:hypothetical protein